MLNNVVVIAGGEVLFLRQSLSWMSAAGLVLVVVGSGFVAQNDARAGGVALMTGQAYFWMAANCLTSAGYVLALRWRTNSGPTSLLQKPSVALINNFTTFILGSICSTLLGETPKSLAAAADQTSLLTILLTGVGSLLLNLAALWCIQLTSATTYAMVGAMNKVVTVLVAAIIFRESLTPSSLLFVSLGIAGGVLYGKGKGKDAPAKKSDSDSLRTSKA